MRKNKSFTLIEMVTVTVVIAILLGLVLTGSFNAIREAKIEKAKAQIKALKAALAMFESDAGFYPGREPGWLRNKFKSWLEDGWFEDQYNGYNWAAVPNTTAPYMNFIDAELVMIDAGDGDDNGFIDPWGTPYNYVCGSPYDSYNLWSCGPDGNNNSGNGATIGGDDIGG
jgi:type II secretory pathway pseudopilin PulG